jgi:hypothetical protein
MVVFPARSTRTARSFLQTAGNATTVATSAQVEDLKISTLPGSPTRSRAIRKRHAPTAMARLERGEYRHLIQSEAGRVLLTASRVDSSSLGDDAQYLAAAGYEQETIQMALGMLEEARAVYGRLSVKGASACVSINSAGQSFQAAEELDAGAIERELESMVIIIPLCSNRKQSTWCMFVMTSSVMV